jgi:hypothetical protein
MSVERDLDGVCSRSDPADVHLARALVGSGTPDELTTLHRLLLKADQDG